MCAQGATGYLQNDKSLVCIVICGGAFYDTIHAAMVKVESKNYKWILLALLAAPYFLAQIKFNDLS